MEEYLVENQNFLSDPKYDYTKPNKDRFFKLPLLNILRNLPIKQPANFNTSQWAMVEGLESHRFFVHIAGRRTGKSWSAAVLAFAKLLEPGNQVMVVAPNFNLSSIIWDYITDFIKQLELETDRFNNKDKVIRLKNRSVFRLLSASNRDSLVGRAANLLIVDEAAVIDDDEYFNRDLRPALSTFPDSRALFISTPRGRGNYLYEYYTRGEPENQSEYPEWGNALYTYKANPLLSEKDVMEAKKAMPKKLFAQEYLCEWTTTEMQIFEISEDRHRIKTGIEPRDPMYQYFAGLDVGYRDATAFVVFARSLVEEKYYIVDEFIVNENTTSQIAQLIQDMEDKWDIETIYVDSSAVQLRADLAYEYDIFCEKAIKDVNAGIAFVQSLIEQDKLFVDEDNASYTFGAIAAYKWNEKTEKPKPVHDWASHPCDAVRYGLYTFHLHNPDIYIG